MAAAVSRKWGGTAGNKIREWFWLVWSGKDVHTSKRQGGPGGRFDPIG